MVTSSRSEYVRAACRKGHGVGWLELSDGSGWIRDSDVRTGDATVELVGHRDDDGSAKHTFWRFEIVARVPVPAGHPGPPSTAPPCSLTGQCAGLRIDAGGSTVWVPLAPFSLNALRV